jgi:hypothetical protein
MNDRLNKLKIGMSIADIVLNIGANPGGPLHRSMEDQLGSIQSQQTERLISNVDREVGIGSRMRTGQTTLTWKPK